MELISRANTFDDIRDIVRTMSKKDIIADFEAAYNARRTSPGYQLFIDYYAYFTYAFEDETYDFAHTLDMLPKNNNASGEIARLLKLPNIVRIHNKITGIWSDADADIKRVVEIELNGRLAPYIGIGADVSTWYGWFIRRRVVEKQFVISKYHPEGTGDERKAAKGRECNTYNGSQLTEILRYIGTTFYPDDIRVRRTLVGTVPDKCSLLYDLMSAAKLIIYV